MAKKINPMLAIVGGVLAVLLLFAIISIVFYPGQDVVVDDPHAHGDGHGVEGDHDAEVDHGSEGDHGAEENDAADTNDSDTPTDDNSADDNASSTDDDTAANNGITAAVGDTVSVHYIGKFENGTVFASTNRETGAQPIVIVLGQNTIVKGFDAAVLGMKKGETKTAVVQPSDGFPSDPAKIVTFDRTQIVSVFGSVPEVGSEITFSNGNQISKGVVQEVTSTTVIIDFNSNTVGKVLTYEITVIDISRN